MKKKGFVRAGYLQVGTHYFLRGHTEGDGTPVYTKVKFIDITSCPAVVVVQNERKDCLRCNRSDLYIPVRA